MVTGDRVPIRAILVPKPMYKKKAEGALKPLSIAFAIDTSMVGTAAKAMRARRPVTVPLEH